MCSTTARVDAPTCYLSAPVSMLLHKPLRRVCGVYFCSCPPHAPPTGFGEGLSLVMASGTIAACSSERQWEGAAIC